MRITTENYPAIMSLPVTLQLDHKQLHACSTYNEVITFVLFQYAGDTELNGEECAKWEHSFTIYDKVNTYTLYTTKTRPPRPLRYEMMGYDTLLSSYYDHYILDYHEFEAWNFTYKVFDIPTGMCRQPYSQALRNHSLFEEGVKARNLGSTKNQTTIF